MVGFRDITFLARRDWKVTMGGRRYSLASLPLMGRAAVMVAAVAAGVGHEVALVEMDAAHNNWGSVCHGSILPTVGGPVAAFAK